MPARILEIISPGGFEEAFREIDTLEGEPDPSQIAAIAGRYGCEVDFERTMPDRRAPRAGVLRTGP